MKELRHFAGSREVDKDNFIEIGQRVCWLSINDVAHRFLFILITTIIITYPFEDAETEGLRCIGERL